MRNTYSVNFVLHVLKHLSRSDYANEETNGCHRLGSDIVPTVEVLPRRGVRGGGAGVFGDLVALVISCRRQQRPAERYCTVWRRDVVAIHRDVDQTCL